MPLNPNKSNCLFIFPDPVPADETDISNSGRTLFSLAGNPLFLQNCVKKKGHQPKI
jgi:hypothetical protein